MASVETSQIGYFALDALPPDLSPDQREPLRIAARVRAHLCRQPAAGEGALWDIGGADTGDDEEYE